MKYPALITALVASTAACHHSDSAPATTPAATPADGSAVLGETCPAGSVSVNDGCAPACQTDADCDATKAEKCVPATDTSTPEALYCAGA